MRRVPAAAEQRLAVQNGSPHCCRGGCSHANLSAKPQDFGQGMEGRLLGSIRGWTCPVQMQLCSSRLLTLLAGALWSGPALPLVVERAHLLPPDWD